MSVVVLFFNLLGWLASSFAFRAGIVKPYRSPNQAMISASFNGDMDLIENAVKQGATEFEKAMFWASRFGHIEIVKFCIKHGARDFKNVMYGASMFGYIEIVKLGIKYGARNFKNAMYAAKKEEHIDIVEFHKQRLAFKKVQKELPKYFHKRQFAQKVYDELLPIAWHPDRVWDWCFDEEEKKDLEYLFRR